MNINRLKNFDSGLDKLLISVYDGPKDVIKFEKLCAEALKEDQYFIRHRYLPPEEDFGITLSNRAGMMEMQNIKFINCQNLLVHLVTIQVTHFF